MCEQCKKLTDELNRTRTVAAREANTLQYTRPDSAAAYSFMVQRIDSILRSIEAPIDLRGGRGFLWQQSGLPLPLWEANIF